MRDFKITRNEGEWYKVNVTDSYGKKYMNFFEHAHEANDYVYSVWQNEDWFNSVDQDKLLANAINNCKQIDKQKNIKAIL